MTQATTHCPSRACKGVEPAQEDVTPETLASVGVTGAWLAHARRCTSCGCVYSSEDGSDVLRGYFGNSIVGPGWRSIFGGQAVARKTTP